MNKVLFGAKRANNGEWIDGYYCYFMNEHCILPKNIDVDAVTFDGEPLFIKIIPDTLRQSDPTMLQGSPKGLSL